MCLVGMSLPQDPMPYATEADLDTGWDRNTVNLVTIDPDTNERNAGRIAAALAAATAVIDSYVGRRYPLPLNPSPNGTIVLTQCCVDLAIGRLADSAGSMTEIIQRRVDAAMSFLRDVAAAKADIPVLPDSGGNGAGGSAGQPITPNEAVIEAPPRLFSRQTLRAL